MEFDPMYTWCREKAMAPHSSTLAWKIPWMEEPGRLQSMGSEESDTTERLHFHFSLSCIGEGNGNPLQCSCLENPRDGGAWWAAVYGVAQSRTQLRLSSSSSSIHDAEPRFSCCRTLFSRYLDWFWLDLLCLSSSGPVPPLLTWTNHFLTWKPIWDAGKPFSLPVYKSFIFPVTVQSFSCFKNYNHSSFFCCGGYWEVLHRVLIIDFICKQVILFNTYLFN